MSVEPADPEDTAAQASTHLIFVKVFGFGDAERHAINTLFRLSAGRPQAYALWTEGAPTAARFGLLDGESWEAAVEMENPRNRKLMIFWVGEGQPKRAIQVFRRPLAWSALLDAMDQLGSSPKT